MSKLPLSFSKVRFRGFVKIKADRDVEDVRQIINSVLGINLEWDDSGYFEEVPAAICVIINVRFDLFGIPEDIYITNPHQQEWYVLDLIDLNDYDCNFEINLSPNLVNQLIEKSDLTCEEGEWTVGMIMENCKNKFNISNE